MAIFLADEPAVEQKPHLLLVDDDAFIRDLLRTSVESFGYTCEVAEDGAEAIEKLEKAEFSIVITDMTMPRFDGMQLLKYIKENLPAIEVIVVTGYTDEFTYTEVIKAGASDFLAKPFSVDELEAKLRRVIREQKLISKLEKLSMCDVLTDIFNRRCFDMKLQEEVPRAHRQGYPVFLLLIDVDRFKKYNDNFGHQEGDKILQNIGRILLKSTRENVDWCFRFGGDEFAVIIPYASMDQVGQVAERILERYLEAGYADTSLSIGLARFVRHPGRSWAEDIDDLVSRADRAMYNGKDGGGGQIVCDSSFPQIEPSS
ncbi:MAG: diguanylate cyclase [Desulfobulbaceae bacterium]|nr:diguanylate cyclase [Desulfobulbaceae bacterium]HIJ78384.1 diguanylate cyclase [Deltaproteobacteria bacterium]